MRAAEPDYEYNNRVSARQFTVETYIAKRNGNDRGHNRYQIQHKGAFAYRSIIDCTLEKILVTNCEIHK